MGWLFRSVNWSPDLIREGGMNVSGLSLLLLPTRLLWARRPASNSGHVHRCVRTVSAQGKSPSDSRRLQRAPGLAEQWPRCAGVLAVCFEDRISGSCSASTGHLGEVPPGVQIDMYISDTSTPKLNIEDVCHPLMNKIRFFCWSDHKSSWCSYVCAENKALVSLICCCLVAKLCPALLRPHGL